jgi:hypothetical protein
MINPTQGIIDQIRKALQSHVTSENGTEMRNFIHEWAKDNYIRKNTLSEYLRFMNDHNCTFEKVHPQSTNFPYYFSLFSVVSQSVYGDCIEECLDKAIEYENGKPRFWYTTPQNDGTFKSTYIVNEKENTKLKISKTCNKEYNLNGIDGQYFDIYLNEKLIPHDVIAPTEALEHKIMIVEEPVFAGDILNPSWKTKVVVFRDRPPHHYHPKRYMIEKTKYSKI